MQYLLACACKLGDINCCIQFAACGETSKAALELILDKQILTFKQHGGNRDTHNMSWGVVEGLSWCLGGRVPSTDSKDYRL